MLKKIFGWVMMIINILMFISILVNPEYQSMIFWMIFVFGGEVFMNAKYLESLK